MSRGHNPQYRAALAIVRRLHELGHAAFFAGGCVRDLLLGVAPHDFDVATSATPELVQAAFPHTESVGAHFGVVLVLRLEGDGERIATEVATFRSDGAYSDGRRPDAVRFSDDPRADALRRDFTINALLLDAAAYEAGDPLKTCMHDFVGGESDLAAKMIRAVGEPATRFAEDKLRMLRGVRFAARLDFEIEPRTMAAMQAQAKNIDQVSCERVRDELTRILTEGAARRGLELLDATGLLHEVLPEVERMKGVEQPPEYHPEGDVWVHTLMLLAHLPKGASATLAWGMLLHDVGKPATFTPPDPKKPGDRIRFNGHVEVGVAVARTILARLRFSNQETEQIVALIKHHMQFGDVMKMKQSTLKRFLRLPLFDEHLALHRADCMSAHGDIRLYEFAKAQLETLGEEQIKPKLLLTGDDLIAAGYKPGAAFRTMLEAAEDAQLEGTIASREEALELVRELDISGIGKRKKMRSGPRSCDTLPPFTPSHRFKEQAMAEANVTPAGAPLSQGARVIDTFIAPSKTFTDILRSSNWTLPFIVMVLVGIFFSVTVDKKVGFDQVSQYQIDHNPKSEERMSGLSAAQRAQQLNLSAKVTKGFTYAFPVFILIIAAIAALVLWASFNFGLGAKTTYGQMFAVWIFAGLPKSLAALVAAGLLLAGVNTENFDIQNNVGTNLAYYMPDASPALKAGLSFLDLFGIWTLVLLIIGTAIVARKSKGQAAAVIVGWWVLLLLISVGAAAAFG